MEQLMIFECPLCGHDCENQDGLRAHLHINHRKSHLIDEYLQAIRE